MTLFWIGFWIIFLIVELLTATFYGFSLAVGAFSVAIYTAFVSAEQIDVIQGVIFAIISLIVAYMCSKIFRATIEKPSRLQGLDMYIGESRRVRVVGEDFKIKLDGVDYLVISDDELVDKDLVEIVDRRGSVFIAEKR